MKRFLARFLRPSVLRQPSIREWLRWPSIAWLGVLSGLAVAQTPSQAGSKDTTPEVQVEQPAPPTTPSQSPRGERRPPRHAKHRDRWAAMDPHEREALRSRFRDFRKLEPESREERLQRAQRLRQLIDEVYASMDPALRTQVDRMDRKQRDRYLARVALEEARKRSREVGLVRGRGERFQGERGPGREGPRAQGPRPGGRPDRGGSDAHHAFQKRVLQSIEQHVQTHGLPAGADAAQWQAIQALEGREQGRALRRFVRSHPELRKALPKPPWSQKLDPRQRVLHRSLRLRPEAHLQVMEAEREERKALEWSLRRDQLLRGMTEHPEVFPPEEVAQVRSMDESALRDWIRSSGLHHGTGMRRPPHGERFDRGPRRRGPHGSDGPPGRGGPDGVRPPRGERRSGKRPQARKEIRGRKESGARSKRGPKSQGQESAGGTKQGDSSPRKRGSNKAKKGTDRF